MDPPARYDLFLSHNSRDKAWVEALAEELLDGQNVNCWVDVWAIPAAADWQQEVDTALGVCAGALIALSSEGFGPVHGAEAARALQRQGDDDTFIVIPLVFVDAAQTVGAVLEAARAGSAHLGDELDALLELFASKNCIVLPTDLDAVPRGPGMEKIAAALKDADRPPHPLGPDVLTPIRIRRDARLWAKEGRAATDHYSEERLQSAIQQRLASPGQLDELALEFLEAGTDHHRARRKARLRSLVLAVAILGVLLAAVGILAIATSTALDRTELALRSAQGRNASALAQAQQEQRALAEGIRSVVPGLLDQRHSPEALEGLWRAVAAARTGARLEGTCSPHGEPSLSSDGRTALFGTRDGRPTLVDIAWQQTRQIDIGPDRSASAVAMGPHGERLWVGTAAGQLLAGGAQDRRLTSVATPCRGRITAIADAVPEQVVVACEDRSLVTFDREHNGLVEASRSTTEGVIVSLRHNPRYVFAVGIPTSTILDRATGREVGSMGLQMLLAGDINRYDQVIGIDTQRNVARCQIHEGVCARLPPLSFPDASFEAVAFGGHDEWIVGGDGVGRIVVWEARGGGKVRTFRSTPHDFPISGLSLSDDGRRGLTVDVSGGCRVWRTDHDAARLVLGLPRGDPMRPPWLPADRMGSRRVYLEPRSVLAVSSAGTEPLSLHRDGSVDRWSDETSTTLWSVGAGGDDDRGCLGPTAAGIVRDGAVVVTGPTGVVDGAWARSTAVACRIEDGTLAVTERDGNAAYFDLESGDAVDRRPKRSPERAPSDAAGEPPRDVGRDPGASWWQLPGTKQHLLVTSDARLWLQLASGWVELEYRKLQPAITFASSPDHRLLAGGNALGEIWIWRVEDGGTVVRLTGPGGPITSMEWNSAGDLIVGSTDGAVRVYSASASSLVDEACRLVHDAPADVLDLCAAPQ